MNKDSLNYILIAVLAFLLLKGGDSPSPTPNDVLTAKEAGVAYLSGIADVFEETADRLDENPELVTTIGASVKEHTRAVRESSDQEMSIRLDSIKGDAEQTAEVFRAFAKGYREVAK